MAQRHSTDAVTLFLCGDVMLGRGIDQVLAHPADPRLYEAHVTAATTYVDLAERAHGPIPKPVAPAYVWGDALADLQRVRPDARIVNLETSITRSTTPFPKGINYKMAPDNVDCLTAAGIDGCVLANNHVADWGLDGLGETLDTLARAGIRHAGAGRDAAEAEAPAVLDLGDGRRVIVFAFGTTSSGIPRAWAAGPDTPGVRLLPDLSPLVAERIAERARAVKRPGDILVASLHWGGNWGYRAAAPVEGDDHRRFAHALIDVAGFDIVHGHSSHHALGIEVYRGKPILYGCGDFINDYEGIAGYEAFRGDLAVMYLPTLSASSGTLLAFELIPFQRRKFRLNRAAERDAMWLRDTLNRESARFGMRLDLTAAGTLTARFR